jgi:hypothetical protein
MRSGQLQLGKPLPNPAEPEPKRESIHLTRRRGDAEKDAEKRKHQNMREERSGARVFSEAGVEEAEIAEEESCQLRQEFDNAGTGGRGSDRSGNGAVMPAGYYLWMRN